MSFTPNHLYYEDLELNVPWMSLGRTVLEVDIVNFAGFSGDFNPIHIDHEFAKTTPFRKPIAHGLGVFSMASGLCLAAPPTRVIAMLSVRDWQFLAPVHAGDTIRLRSTVIEKSLKGRGKRGEVVWMREVLNQHDKIVQSGILVTLVECRPVKRPEPDSPANPQTP